MNVGEESKPDEHEIQNEDTILPLTENMATKEKKKLLFRIHKQFGHASVDKLKKKLLACSGNDNSENTGILKGIVKDNQT